MNKLTQVVCSKLTSHRGNKRIWLEGKRLGDIGFLRYATYDTIINKKEKKIVLTLSPQGGKKVSGRNRNGKEIPILDIGNIEITGMLSNVEKITAKFYTSGMIVIEPHHEDKNKGDREIRLKNNLAKGSVKEGSACSGAGVFTAAINEAFSESNIHSKVEWIIDRENAYLQVALNNNECITDDTTIFEASLEELEADLLSPVDILQVSLPCTGHSNAGKVKNKIGKAEEHPTDATALFGLINIIKKANPAIISSENVTEAQSSASYGLLKAELQRIGYVVYETTLDHTQAGTLERRKRYWFMAISKGIDTIVNKGLENITQYAKQFKTLGDILEPIPANHKSWADNQYLKDKAIKDKAAGKRFANRQLLTEDADGCGTIGRHYNKRRSTEPFMVNAEGKERLLTPIEHARVKGIPEVFVRDVSATTAHQILGQSGLWNNAKGIGLRIAEILNEIKLKEAIQ